MTLVKRLAGLGRHECIAMLLLVQIIGTEDGKPLHNLVLLLVVRDQDDMW